MPELGTIYDMKRAAAFCTISVSLLEKLTAAGEGPARIELGGRRKAYAEADLKAWLYSRRRVRPARVAEAVSP
jgi:predicted DNA-binding transcriptional regulator AlpA